MVGKHVLFVLEEEVVEAAVRAPIRFEIIFHKNDLLFKFLHECGVPSALKCEFIYLKVNVLHFFLVDVSHD
jgi:hypothetical protein